MRTTLRMISASALITFVQASALAADPSDVLPVSAPVQARVMQIGMPSEAKRIAEKMQAALASQPDWAKSFISAAKPGQPLPYHPNFQISELEYKSLLAAASKPSLVQIGSVSLIAEKQANGTIRLSTFPATSKVHGIVIAPDRKSVTTPLATLTEISSINNQNAEAATGRWTGTQWRHQARSAARAISLKFAVGNRSDHGDNIIYYDVSAVQDGRNQEYHEILLFSLPK